jgi:hypothetical protein
MKDTIFNFDSEQKKLINDISSLCGIKQDTVKQIWMYTLFTSYLKLLEEKDRSINTIEIPFIGTIVIKFDKEKKQFAIEPESRAPWVHIHLKDELKDMVAKIKMGDETDLVKYFQDNFINKVIDQYEE